MIIVLCFLFIYFLFGAFFFRKKNTVEPEVPGFFYTSFQNKVLFYSPFINRYVYWRTGTLTLSLFLIVFTHIILSFLLSCAFHSLFFSSQQYCPHFSLFPFFTIFFHQTCSNDSTARKGSREDLLILNCHSALFPVESIWGTRDREIDGERERPGSEGGVRGVRGGFCLHANASGLTISPKPNHYAKYTIYVIFN